MATGNAPPRFGSVEEQYDQFRPSYPKALIDDLVALGPTDGLDVGCEPAKWHGR